MGELGKEEEEEEEEERKKLQSSRTPTRAHSFGELRGDRFQRQSFQRPRISRQNGNQNCETTGFEVREREVCETLTREECETIQVTKYRKEIDQVCKTKIDQV